MILELDSGKGAAVTQHGESSEESTKRLDETPTAQRIGAPRDPRELRPAAANRTAALLLLIGLLLIVAALVARALIG